MTDWDSQRVGTPDRPVEKQSALVVEADPSSASVVCRSLTELGFGVKTVVSGVEAVIAARQNPPAVIFLALQLRDVTGVDLAVWLRANPTLMTVPIIAMHSSEEDIPDLQSGVFNARLRKPTTFEKVADVVRNARVRTS